MSLGSCSRIAPEESRNRSQFLEGWVRDGQGSRSQMSDGFTRAGLCWEGTVLGGVCWPGALATVTSANSRR